MTHMQDDLSYMFSNKSVAEHASLAIGLGLLANPKCNFLSHIDHDTATSVERCELAPYCSLSGVSLSLQRYNCTYRILQSLISGSTSCINSFL